VRPSPNWRKNSAGSETDKRIRRESKKIYIFAFSAASSRYEASHRKTPSGISR
jgi:hypothetical protein